MFGHARSTKNYNTNSTALAQHPHKFKHNFDFKEVKILEYEQNFEKRLRLEMFHIKKNNNSINFRTDIKNLSYIYFIIILLNFLNNQFAYLSICKFKFKKFSCLILL